MRFVGDDKDSARIRKATYGRAELNPLSLESTRCKYVNTRCSATCLAVDIVYFNGNMRQGMASHCHPTFEILETLGYSNGSGTREIFTTY